MSNHVHPKKAPENAAQCPDIRGQNSRAPEKCACPVADE